MTIKKTWRNDPGLIFEAEYKKKFAWFPVECKDEQRIWWKHYYVEYHNWGHSLSGAKKAEVYEAMYHQDFIGNISEEEYMVRKLADTL